MAATVQVITDPIMPDDVPSGGARADQGDIAAKRAELFARMEAADTSSRTIDLEKLTADAEEQSRSREMVESVLVRCPVNGTLAEVEFGPPPGISMTMRLATIVGEKNPNRIEMAMLRTLMHVRKINGEKVTPINSEVEATFLANMLGDQTMNFLYETMVETWPPAAKGDLQIISKNLRRP